jgi:hypothetical protein
MCEIRWVAFRENREKGRDFLIQKETAYVSDFMQTV